MLVPDKDETKDISGAEVETRPAQFPYLSLDLNKSPESLKVNVLVLWCFFFIKFVKAPFSILIIK